MGPLALVRSAVCPRVKNSVPRCCERTLPITPSLLKAYDVASEFMAYLHGDLAVADAVLAVEGERANIERTHDDLPSSGPRLRLYA